MHMVISINFRIWGQRGFAAVRVPVKILLINFSIMYTVIDPVDWIKGAYNS